MDMLRRLRTGVNTEFNSILARNWRQDEPSITVSPDKAAMSAPPPGCVSRERLHRSIRPGGICERAQCSSLAFHLTKTDFAGLQTMSCNTGIGNFKGNGMAMKIIKRLVQIVLAAIASLQMTACSKTVQWQEEVPLNTGETIWVKRTVVYSAQGGAGNPLDIAYRPEKDQVIEFIWSGKSYRYEGDARIMLLAISPSKVPTLVANAEDNAWRARHNYACTIPYYVQLVPDQSGGVWAWPPKVETWLFGLPANLLLSRHQPDQMKTRYTAADRLSEDATGALQAPWQQKIDTANTGDLCRQKGK